MVLRILRAGVKIVLGINNIRQRLNVFCDTWNINNRTNINSAMTDEHAYTRLFFAYIFFGREFTLGG